MNRHQADLAAELVATVSHDLIRSQQAALSPRQPMSVQERRENLLALAQVIVRESGWSVAPVVTPALRPLVKYYSNAVDPSPPFGRLLLSVRDCDAEGTSAALARLVVEDVAA